MRVRFDTRPNGSEGKCMARAGGGRAGRGGRGHLCHGDRSCPDAGATRQAAPGSRRRLRRPGGDEPRGGGGPGRPHRGRRDLGVAPRRFGTRSAGKAMDDRMLLAVMDLLLAGLEPSALQYDLWFAATVQEENGLHGAKALAQSTAFDLVLALDVGLVGDVPTVGEREYPARLGGGPTLVHKDRIIHYDRRFLWQLARVAETHGIPYQHGVYARYSSHGSAVIDPGSPAAQH